MGIRPPDLKARRCLPEINAGGTDPVRTTPPRPWPSAPLAARPYFLSIAKGNAALGRPAKVHRARQHPVAGPARNLFPSGRNRPETDGPYQYEGGVKSTEAIMLVPILNLVYREFLRSVLSGMATQGARR